MNSCYSNHLNWRYYTYGCSKNVILNASLNILSTKFKYITGTFSDKINIGTLISYPDGFTRQNTVIVSQHYGNESSLRDQFYGSELAMTTTLRIDGIEVTPRNSILFGHSFKIVLMKI